MIHDKRFQSVLLIFLIISVFALILTLSPGYWLNTAYVIAITVFAFLFAWLCKRKVTPIPLRDGDFKKDLVLMLIFFVCIMIVRFTGYWQQMILAEKAGMIALTFSAILLIDRSSPKYFGLDFSNIWRQLLWFVAGVAIIWTGFAIYRIGAPLILNLDSTGIMFNLPTFDARMIAYVISCLVWNFAEEIFFRGYVLTKLGQSSRFWIALLVSSTLFALYHFNYILSYHGGSPVSYILSYLGFTFIFGLGMGLFYKVSGSILASTLVHAFWNVFFASRYLVPKVYLDFGKTYLPSSDWDYIFASVFFVVFMLVWYLIKKSRARRCGQAI